jgi:hypothetical protein
MPRMATRGKARRSREYLGGLFDGEGSISIVRHLRRDARHGWMHELSVKVGMVDRVSVETYHGRWGGTFYPSKQYLKHPDRWHQAFSWDVSRAAAVRFLTEMRPHIHGRRPQLDLALKFQATFKPFGSAGVPDAVWKFREECRIQMRTLNGNRHDHKPPAETKREGTLLE